MKQVEWNARMKQIERDLQEGLLTQEEAEQAREELYKQLEQSTRKRHAAKLLQAASTLLANSRLLEQLSEPLQACYAKLRATYGNRVAIEIKPHQDELKVTFTRNDPKNRTSSVYANACIGMTRNKAKIFVTGTSEEYGDMNKRCAHPRDVVYNLDTWLDH